MGKNNNKNWFLLFHNSVTTGNFLQTASVFLILPVVWLDTAIITHYAGEAETAHKAGCAASVCSGIKSKALHS